jgi:hypothetical protein
MKKFILGLTVTIGITLLSVPVVIRAQLTTTAEITAQQIIPWDVDAFYQIDTTITNPVETLIANLISESLQDETLLTSVETKEIVENNVFSLATKTLNEEGDIDLYITFYLDPDIFTKLMNSEKENNTVTEKTYKGFTTYVEPDGISMAYIYDQLLIITNTEANLKTAIDNICESDSTCTTDSLLNSDNYKKVMTDETEDSFLKMYVNPSLSQMSGLEDVGFNELTTNLVSSIDAISIALKQSGTGFSVYAAIKGDEDKLLENNFLFNKYNFTPSLYKLVSGTNLIYYGEEFNIKGKIDDIFKFMTLDSDGEESLASFKAEFKTETGIDIDTEIMPLLTNEAMLTVHNDEQLLPAITVMLKLGTNTTSAKATLTKLANYLKENSGLTYEQVKIDNTTFNDLTVAIGDDQTLHLRMGVTSAGNMIISTISDLDKYIGTNGLTSNTSFKAAFPTISSKEISSIFFFSTDNLQKYLTSLVDLTTTDKTEATDAKEVIDSLLDSWHDIYSVSYATADTAWGTITINAAIKDIAAYLENNSSEIEAANEKYIAPITENFVSYCDVTKTDWFYEYVANLSARGIIKGYSDGCFKPGQSITRAEFVTLLMKGTGADISITSAYKPFYDVANGSGEWYSEYVNMAAKAGYTKGYSDGTFHPSANISRAEAVAILYNMSDTLQSAATLSNLESLIQFSDVKSTDWFFLPVVACKYFGIIQGTTVFEPARNINRAEAAKTVKLFLEL